MTTAASELRLTLLLSPHGRLMVVAQDDAPVLEAGVGERIRSAFDRGSGHGLERASDAWWLR